MIGPVTGQVIGQDVEVWLHCECTDEPPMLDDGGSGGGGTGGGFGSPIGGGGTGGGGTPGDSGGSGGLIGQPSPCDGGAGFADENGNCFSMEQVLAAELVNLLSQDPDALIDLPCSELQKYQALAQHKVAGSGLRKLQNLQSSRDQNFWQELTGTDDWQVQDINEAAGTVVNMDYFPITISKLPNGYTAASLLEHIRKNINDFTNDDAYFQPYPGIAGEEALWNSSNPLDAIISIELLPWDDGSVIVSDKRTRRWIFSVIQSPLDYQHPVSGNREFGYTRNTDGSYTFYTRGVDRLTTSLENGVRNAIFATFDHDMMNRADNLWVSFQDEVKKFVDERGGNSSLPPDSKRNQGARPDWEKIKKYLNGEITLNQLRNDC